MNIPIIKELVIIFIVSLGVIFIFNKFKLPSIVGFLIAGMIIGPYGFGFISEGERIEVMAEIGVVLLLFTIGLEISLTRLLRIKRLLLLGGGLQVAVTLIIASTIFILAGLKFNLALMLGMLVCLSSTAIVLKLLSDRNELHSPAGKISVGILIFQDLAVVPMMLLLPVLSGAESIPVPSLILKFSVAFIILGAVIILEKYFVPKVLFHLANTKLREAFTIGVILLILATAYFTHLIGLSLALGAFIAGIILSESEFSHQVVAEIIPFKDAFNSLFFVSIGLLLNLSFVLNNSLLILGITSGLIFLKALVIIVIIVVMRYPLRIGLITALTLAQVGEFSFILAQAGMNFNIIPPDYYNAFLASSIASMMLTPLLIKIAPSLAMKFKDIDISGIKEFQEIPEDIKLKNHVIIAGFGVNGKNIARVLKETGIQYIILELNPETVESNKARGEKIFFGDITRREVLSLTKIESANVMVFTISDPSSLRTGIKLAKEMNPSIYCIVRTRFVNEVDELIKIGADEVIPEEFETSLQIFNKVLEKYHIPLNIIMRQTNIIRQESYGMLRREAFSDHPLSQLDKILAEGLTESYFVEDTNPNINKSLKDLNLRAISGATIIAIIRDGKTHPNPAGKEIIKPADIMILYGNHMAVDKAIEILNK